MNVPAAFVLGLLIGWLAEWIIDWSYWRARMRQMVEKNPDLEKANSRLDEENAELRQRLSGLEDEIIRIKTSGKAAQLLKKDGAHNFQAIKGIGPAFSKRLNEAGIQTFEQLAQLTPQEMEKILGTLYKRFFSKKNTILTQAQEFAKQISSSQGKQKG